MTLDLLDALAEARAALARVAVRRDDLGAAASSELLSVVRVAGELRRVADTALSAAGGELDRRSAARESGARTTEELLQSHTGLTGREAATAVRVGRLAQADELGPVAVRMLDGAISVAEADAIRSGLLGADVLAEAAELLCDEAPALGPDRLFKRARELRDELDEAGVADREAVLRGRRSLTRIDLRDGMKRLIWDYDPETAGVVDEVYDRATSPRRGGPRFVDAEEAARARRVADDPRSTAQLASDAFAELLRQGAAADTGTLLGHGIPAVRVIVSAEDLERRAGHGVVEGSHEALSITTVERLACAFGVQPVSVDGSGRVLDLGREQRLFSSRQRVALAVRDGGCLWPSCERPPSWTEAHHIDPWSEGGRTDLDRGVLLCRWHHLLLHNDGWAVRMRAGRYWLEPPPGSGREGALLESKSRALREHLAHASSA